MSQRPAPIPNSDAPLPASPPADGADAADGAEELVSNRRLLFQYVPSWVTSFALHIAVVILLALIPILVQKKETVSLVAGDAGPAVESPAEIILDPLEDLSGALEQQSTIDVTEPMLQPLSEAPQVENVSQELALHDVLNLAPIGSEASESSMSAPESGENEFAARAEAGSSEAAKRAGATAASEECVALGLQWLAAHQLEDGSWNFNHQIGSGDRSSPNPGQFDDCPIGATGMCLMAFLGNGQTHLEGQYKTVVNKALNYLIEHQRRVNEFSGSLVDSKNRSGMYSHALATIALAEAYGMTKDSTLHDPAQSAINFIVYAQDPAGGGWRYSPKEVGDLSVSGWMLMAVKSGLMGELEVSRVATKKSARFLDAVAFDSGAKYCYRAGNQDPSPNMTSVGLLCRMYMGWKHDQPALMRGVKYMARLGPQIGDSTNMYFNYYATQVLRQYGGPEWTEWNKEMRDYLVKTQSREGPTKGSWFFDSGTDPGPAAGGRVYCTAMSIMTLEVYYRFLPIYRDAAMIDEFPLD